MADITLHVGLGTFNPVEVEDLSKHKMDSEELIIDQQAVDMVNNAKANKGVLNRHYVYACARKCSVFYKTLIPSWLDA